MKQSSANLDATDRTCESCGRRMDARQSDRGASAATPRRYCSAACRRRKVSTIDRELESATLALLDARPLDASICPSEAARAVFPGDDEGWRDLMEPARRAARRLVAKGLCEITQKNRIVDPSTAKGPLRVRRARQ